MPLAVNSRPDRPFPLYAVVPPNGGELFLANVSPVLRGASSTFKTSSTWALGDFTARPDGSVYRLPYQDGEEFRIGQSPDGAITTHTDQESLYAVDINMPEGTPVVAARDGVVIKTQTGFTKGGKDPRLKTAANEVQILHSDGTIAVYAHLAPGGVHVYPGQRVTVGMKIGLSGNTGYSSGPHLHMAVIRLVKTAPGLASESLRFNFYLGAPPVSFPPRQGQLVRAQYANAARIPEPYETRVAISIPTFGQDSRGGTDAPYFTLVVPEDILQKVRAVESWQWLVGMLTAVVGIMALSNYRHARRRRAMNLTDRCEPGFDDL